MQLCVCVCIDGSARNKIKSIRYHIGIVVAAFGVNQCALCTMRNLTESTIFNIDMVGSGVSSM